MKTRILTPIGLLAGITLSLSAVTATAQEEDRRPSPRMDGERQIQRDQIDRLIDAYLRGTPRMDERPAAKEAVDRREKRMQLERAMEIRRREAPGEGVRMRQSMDAPGDRRPREFAEKAAMEPRRQAAPQRPQNSQEIPPRVKIQHLRQAVEHLQAAGFPDQADAARKAIGRIMEQVRRDSASDANPELMQRVEKLSREVEELRQQLRRMKADAAPNPPRHPEERRPDAPPEGQVR